MSETIFIKHTVRVKDNQIFLDENLMYSKSNEDDFATAAYKHFNISYPKFYKMDLMSKWGIICAELLLQNEILDDTDPFKKALVFQNSSSSLVTDKNYQGTVNTIPSPALFVYTLPNIVMGEIAIKHNFKGENTFFITPAFDAVQLTEYTEMLFKNGVAEIALCGYLEATNESQDVVMWLVTRDESEFAFSKTNLEKYFNPAII